MLLEVKFSNTGLTVQQSKDTYLILNPQIISPHFTKVKYLALLEKKNTSFK